MTAKLSFLQGDLCVIELYSSPKYAASVNIDCGHLQFLTTAMKRKILKGLATAIRERAKIRGKKVDRQMIPYLNRFNSIPGVCSRFCCMGHRGGYSGNFLIFANQKMHNWFSENWSTVAAWPECVNVATGCADFVARWDFEWKVTKHKSYYREFLDKFIPFVRRGYRESLSPIGLTEADLEQL